MYKTSNLLIAFGLLLLPLVLDAQVFKKLRIDPAQAHGGTVSEYFDEVEYIPLETTKESLFGEAIKFIVTDSGFVLFDPDTNALLFFGNDGKFFSKMKYPNGVRPEITSDLFARNIFVRHREPTNVIEEVFDFTGKRISEKKIQDLSMLNPDMYNIRLNDSVYIVQNSCYYPMRRKPKDEIINSIEIHEGNKPPKVFMPVNQKEQAAYCGLSPGPIINISPPQNGMSYVTTTFTHFIYKLTQDEFKGLYQLVFPSNRTVPKNYIETKNEKLIDSLRQTDWLQQEDLIVRVRNVSIMGDFLFFKIDPGKYIWTESSVANAQYNFIYNLKTDRLVSLERISPNAKSFFLPVSNGPRTNVDGVVNFNGYNYLPISALRMFSSFEKQKAGNPQYPPVLQEYFKTQNRKSNPVIVKMKLKE